MNKEIVATLFFVAIITLLPSVVVGISALIVLVFYVLATSVKEARRKHHIRCEQRAEEKERLRQVQELRKKVKEERAIRERIEKGENIIKFHKKRSA